MGCWRSERSPPSTARWRRNWRFGSQRTASPETRRHCLNGIRRNFSLDNCMQVSQYLLLLIRFNESIHRKICLFRRARARFTCRVHGFDAPHRCRRFLGYELSDNHQAALKRNKRGLQMKSRLAWFSIALFVVLVSTSLFAQDTASITGTVTDPSGAAVKGAQVRVSSPEKGIDRTTTTNGEGEYLISALPPGTYDLAISARGFKKYQAKG